MSYTTPQGDLHAHAWDVYSQELDRHCYGPSAHLLMSSLSHELLSSAQHQHNIQQCQQQQQQNVRGSGSSSLWGSSETSKYATAAATTPTTSSYGQWRRSSSTEGVGYPEGAAVAAGAGATVSSRSSSGRLSGEYPTYQSGRAGATGSSRSSLDVAAVMAATAAGGGGGGGVSSGPAAAAAREYGLDIGRILRLQPKGSSVDGTGGLPATPTTSAAAGGGGGGFLPRLMRTDHSLGPIRVLSGTAPGLLLLDVDVNMIFQQLAALPSSSSSSAAAAAAGVRGGGGSSHHLMHGRQQPQQQQQSYSRRSSVDAEGGYTSSSSSMGYISSSNPALETAAGGSHNQHHHHQQQQQPAREPPLLMELGEAVTALAVLHVWCLDEQVDQLMLVMLLSLGLLPKQQQEHHHQQQQQESDKQEEEEKGGGVGYEFQRGEEEGFIMKQQECGWAYCQAAYVGLLGDLCCTLPQLAATRGGQYNRNQPQEQQQQHEEMQQQQQQGRRQDLEQQQQGVQYGLLQLNPAALTVRLLVLVALSRWLLSELASQPAVCNACSALVTLYALRATDLLNPSCRLGLSSLRSAGRVPLSDGVTDGVLCHQGFGRGAGCGLQGDCGSVHCEPDLLLLAEVWIKTKVGPLAEAAQMLMNSLVTPLVPGGVTPAAGGAAAAAAVAAPLLGAAAAVPGAGAARAATGVPRAADALTNAAAMAPNTPPSTSPCSRCGSSSSSDAGSHPPYLLQLLAAANQGMLLQLHSIGLLPALVVATATALKQNPGEGKVPAGVLKVVIGGLLGVVLEGAPGGDSCLAGGLLGQLLLMVGGAEDGGGGKYLELVGGVHGVLSR